MKFRVWLLEHKFVIFRVVLVIVLVVGASLGLFYQDKIARAFRFVTTGKTTPEESKNVSLPTIINGELVLPKISGGVGDNNLAGGIGQARLSVLTASLMGIFDQQSQKLTAVRIVGEVLNNGTKIVNQFSPVVGFIDASGKPTEQKVGNLSMGYFFFDLLPGDKEYYDVTVDVTTPPDRMQILLNPSSATSSAVFEQLKIADRNFETKTADQQAPQTSTQQSSSDSGEVATPAATPTPAKVDYYSATGSVFNQLDDMVTEITVYAWVKDLEGKVIGFARQDFKNDLISPGGKVDFHLTVLPFYADKRMESYELVAWGKRYKIGN